MGWSSAHLLQVFQSDDCGVLELEEVVEFAVGAFGVDEVLKGVDDLLDGDDAAGALVAAAEDHAVGALPDLLLDLVLLVDLVVQLLRLFHSENIIITTSFENTPLDRPRMGAGSSRNSLRVGGLEEGIQDWLGDLW
jgi:hypothetical protein